jgi:hypothetical protein
LAVELVELVMQQIDMQPMRLARTTAGEAVMALVNTDKILPLFQASNLPFQALPG